MSAWLSHHGHALWLSLKRFGLTPAASALNVAVIGIAISLPAGGYVLLKNLQTLSGQISGAPQISLFLALDASKNEIAKIEGRLRQHPLVERYEFVPKAVALKKIQEASGLGDTADKLAHNPLPDAFVVHVKDAAPEAVEALHTEMQAWPKVEHAQLDAAWVKRLAALLRLAKITGGMLAALLSFALVAVTFNTIRLQILTQRDEIEVSKLIGATNSFIRRPFLYFGALSGLAGGGMAWLIVSLGVFLLDASLADLSQLYAFDFSLQPMSAQDSISLLLFSSGLGWLGAWLSVGRHLAQIGERK